MRWPLLRHRVVFLSGGTDSSTIAGVLRDVTQERPRTYSIGFDQKGFDEMKYARIAAQRFDTDQHEYYVTPQDIVDLVPKISTQYGQPYGNSSVIPTYYCARMAEADGITKILGGDGGDELFGGNDRYATQVLFSYYGQIPSALRGGVIEPLLNRFPLGDKIYPVRKAKRYIEQARVPMPDRLFTYGYLNLLGPENIVEDEFLSKIDRDEPVNSMRKPYSDILAHHLINKMAAFDFKLTLADNDLPKVNRMCALAGIDVGYPFLQSPMVEISSKLPVQLKVKGLKIRYFFKEALRGYLPDEILTKKKHGFGLPFGDWLISHDVLQGMAFDSLNSLKKRGIIRPDFIDDLINNKLKAHPNYYGGLIWILMILEQWFDADA